jgi:type II secretory pathway component PulJ
MRNEEGFTLVELLIAATLMLIILFATFNMLDNFNRLNARTTDLITEVDTARTAMSRLTRDLRDATAASTTVTPGRSVLLRAEPQDLVMRRINPFGAVDGTNATGAHTVRWCLDRRGNLHRQTAIGVNTPNAPCPDPRNTWVDTIQAQQIVNDARPVFTYNSAVLEEISTVNTFLAIDRKVGQAPDEATLTSGVFLRNQNRAPTASFSYVGLGGRNVQLNAQASRDPEGGILDYEWKDGSTILPYKSAVVSYIPPSTGNRNITLKVTDVDGLTDEENQIVDVKP